MESTPKHTHALILATSLLLGCADEKPTPPPTKTERIVLDCQEMLNPTTLAFQPASGAPAPQPEIDCDEQGCVVTLENVSQQLWQRTGSNSSRYSTGESRCFFQGPDEHGQAAVGYSNGNSPRGARLELHRQRKEAAWQATWGGRVKDTDANQAFNQVRGLLRDWQATSSESATNLSTDPS